MLKNAERLQNDECCCRKSQDRDRDMKLLLDMHKCVPKEARDKAQVSRPGGTQHSERCPRGQTLNYRPSAPSLHDVA